MKTAVKCWEVWKLAGGSSKAKITPRKRKKHFADLSVILCFIKHIFVTGKRKLSFCPTTA